MTVREISWEAFECGHYESKLFEVTLERCSLRYFGAREAKICLEFFVLVESFWVGTWACLLARVCRRFFQGFGRKAPPRCSEKSTRAAPDGGQRAAASVSSKMASGPLLAIKWATSSAKQTNFVPRTCTRWPFLNMVPPIDGARGSQKTFCPKTQGK